MTDNLGEGALEPEEHAVLLTDQEREENTYTLAQVIDRDPIGAFQMNVTLFAGLQWTAAAMVVFQLGFLAFPLACEWNLSEYQVALLTTLFFLGNMLIGPLYGIISDKYGRKRPIVISTFFLFFFGIMSALSPNYLWLVVNRLILGISIVGIENVPAYCVEFTPIRFRGSSVLLLQLFWGVGGSLDAMIAYLTLNGLGWRYFVAISTLPAALLFIYSLVMPESPRFLLARGDSQGSEKVLRLMAKINCRDLPAGRLTDGEETITTISARFRKEGDSSVETEIRIRQSQSEKAGFISILSILFGRKQLFTTVLINLIWFISWFIYYGIILITTEILHRDYCGQNGNSPHSDDQAARGCQYLTDSDFLDTFITYMSEFPGIIFNLILTECLGRKFTLLLEFLLSGAGFMLMLICSLSSSTAAKTILIFVSRAAISSSIQVEYLLTPELYPTKARGSGLSLSATIGSIGALITPFLAQVLIRSSYEATLMVYGGLALSAAILSIFLTETKGKILK